MNGSDIGHARDTSIWVHFHFMQTKINMSSRARRKQRKLPFEVLPPAVSFSLLIVRKVSLAFDES